MHHRSVTFALATSAVLGSVVSAGFVQAHDRTHRVRATFEATSGAPVPSAPTCDPDGNCVIPYTIAEATYTGDMRGSSTTSGVLVVDAATGYTTGTSYQLFTGEITGCGTGTVVIALPEFESLPGEPIIATGSIVDGSGTGGLDRVSGTITNVFTSDASGAGSAVGRIDLRCG
jgi:Protein of unknown function (DUF3224)